MQTKERLLYHEKLVYQGEVVDRNIPHGAGICLLNDGCAVVGTMQSAGQFKRGILTGDCLHLSKRGAVRTVVSAGMCSKEIGIAYRSGDILVADLEKHFSISGDYLVYVGKSGRSFSFRLTSSSTVEEFVEQRVEREALLSRILDPKSPADRKFSKTSEGSRLYGADKNNESEGLGLVVKSQLEFTAGLFRNGKLNSLCRVSLPGRDVYFGQMKDDFPDGEGLYYHSEQKKWIFGLYKKMECLKVLKDGITNPQSLKHKVMKLHFQKSKPSERMDLELAVPDLFYSVAPRLQSVLEGRIEGFVGFQLSKTASHKQPEPRRLLPIDRKIYSQKSLRTLQQAPDSARKKSKEAETIHIYDTLDMTHKYNSSSSKLPTTANLSARDKSELEKEFQGSSPLKEEKGDMFSFVNFRDGVGQGYLGLNHSGLSSNLYRLGTIPENDEDFCKSVTSGPQRPSPDSKSPIHPDAHFSNLFDSPPKQPFHHRPPSPKPLNHFEASPTTTNAGLAGKPKNSGSIFQINLLDPGNKMGQFLKRTAEDPFYSAKTSSIKLNAVEEEPWQAEPRSRFQAAVDKLNKLGRIVQLVQMEVAKSRETKAFF